MARPVSNAEPLPPNARRFAHNAMANRMKKLCAGEEVDWVELAIADLGASSCKTRKTAIATLLAHRDPLKRSIGPLEDLAKQRICGSAPAQKAADAIRKR